MNKLIYIILKNHDALKFTIPCIESLKNTSYKNKKILVVDDNSKYIPRKECNKLGVELISLNKYSDFCRCFNVGIKRSIEKGAGYIFIVNNDTRNFSKNYFEKMIRAFRDPKVGAVGSKCLNYDGSIQWGATPHVSFGISMNIPTCGYILRAEMLKSVGGFDLSLYRYFEDLDLIARLRLAGWKTVYVPDVHFEHFGSGTSDKMPYITNYYQARNLIWFIKRHLHQKKIIKKIRYAANYLWSQFKSIWGRRNKTVALYSMIGGIFTGLFTTWHIEHEI